ncbi:ABC transporter substrate-binding protein [Nakamurella panacisegetis]|uniref:ABC transporter substrate-binding protein n=1 Tax=Nakamurella panacisegetis TaxID=1090615 RepID=UPI0018D2DD1B|nr:ABC transporter substrate-binding protein [Nakamurella panacisegetis]
MNRRNMLRILGAGAASAAALPILSACTGTSSSGTTTSAGTTSAGTTSAAAAGSTPAAATSAAASGASSSAAGSSSSSAAAQIGGSVTFGSNASDATPKAAYASVFKAFKQAQGVDVKVNTVDHNSFQENINNYLQGSPDEVFTWFAGNRMQFFAAQGLLTPIDDIWSGIENQYSDGFKSASTAADGKKYFIPFYNYPWAFFYRPSVFKAKGYTVPKTLDELKTLAAKMQKDGLTPIAFADKDGWPAMGTFDYLNQRINGYQFHMDLVASHKESWTDPKVKTVFDTWKSLFPYQQTGALGRTWQEAAQTLVKKQAGMYLLGMFVGQQFPAGDTDIDFFPFPEVDSNVGMDAVEAPIDGFLLSSKGESPQAKALLTYLASPEAQLLYLGGDPSNVAANKTASTAKYTALQKKAVELISSAKTISQFLDRDSRPDFASPVVIPALQQFLKDGDSDAVTKSLEAQAKTIFTS